MVNFFELLSKTTVAIVHSPVWIFMAFLTLMVISVALESSRIGHARSVENKRYQTYYCNKFDSFKCENGGILGYSEEKGFACACPSDYVGTHCQRVKPMPFITWIASWFQLGNSDMSRGGPTMWWSFIPFTSKLQLETVYSFHQNVLKKLENVFSGVGNNAYAARMLPRARPLLCPNDKNLPPMDILYNEILERKHGQFKPDPKNRNLLFNAFYQYFVLQFFNAESNLTVTASQLYGSDVESEKSLRSFSGGKLKTLYFNNKHFAVHSTSSALYSNAYLKKFVKSMSTPSKSVSTDRSWFRRMISRKPKRVEMLSTSPILFAVSTLWVREHNRVCDMLLSQMSPGWTDEEIYTTARRIITGQMMTIMMNEIINVNTEYAYPLKLRPELNHYQNQKISGSAVPIELVLTMAVSSLPEQFKSNYISSTFFGNSSQVLDDGIKKTLKFMVSQTLGKVTAHNDGATTEPLTKILMKLSREHSLQSFNNYRRLFGLPAYNNFYELTRNWKTACELKSFYGTVDDVELLTGVLTEGTIKGTLPTATVMTNSFIINAIMTNHLTSQLLWKPDTFGGDDFFGLVKSANLKSFICRNLDENCEGLKVGLYAE